MKQKRADKVLTQLDKEFQGLPINRANMQAMITRTVELLGLAEQVASGEVEFLESSIAPDGHVVMTMKVATGSKTSAKLRAMGVEFESDV